MKYYDANGDGNISYDEFISGLRYLSNSLTFYREELPERRKKLVDKAFKILDKTGEGILTVEDLIGVYDVSMNPEFIEGRKSKQQMLEEFLYNYLGPRGKEDGKVTYEEFLDYYSDVSMSIPSDEYFVRMMESTWQCPECEEDPKSRETIAMLMREVKQRILEKANNDPKNIKKIFSKFDLNQSGHLTVDNVTNMIAKLKISVERKYVYPFLKKVDKNNSGGIEFDEFENYLFSDN